MANEQPKPRMCDKCKSWQLPATAHFRLYTQGSEKPKQHMILEMCIHCPVCNYLYKTPFEIKEDGTASAIQTA